MKRGYAVVRLCSNGWEIDTYHFDTHGYARALVRAGELNRAVKRKEYGVFAAIDTGNRVGLWFEDDGA